MAVALSLCLGLPASHAQTPEPDSPPKSAELIVVEWEIRPTATSFEVYGRVKNNSTRQYDSIYVTAWISSNRGRVTARPVPISQPNLPSGAESDFHISVPRTSADEFTVNENVDLSAASLRFHDGTGRSLLARLPKWTTTRNTTSQLKALESETSIAIEERKQAAQEAAAKSRRLLPAWWAEYEKVTAPLLAAEIDLRAAYRAEGRPDSVRREVLALKQPLLYVAKTLTRAPDQRVQADVQQMMIKLASAIEKHSGGSMFGFQNDYADAVKLIKKLDQQRRASKTAP